jgi:hypothetical protein
MDIMQKITLSVIALSLLAAPATFAEENEDDLFLLSKKAERMWKATEDVPGLDSLGKDTVEALGEELWNQPSKSQGAVSLAGYKAVDVATAELKKRKIDLNVFQQMHVNKTERFYAVTFSPLPLFSSVSDGGGVTVVLSKTDFSVMYVFRRNR